MTVTMYQADRNFVTPANDASLYSALAGDLVGSLNRGSQFMTSVDGMSVTIGTGQALIKGRLVEITKAETIVLPSNSSGNICLVVDLTKTNDVSGSAGDQSYAVSVNQAYVAAVTSTLTQDDLNNGGLLYEFPIASFSSTATMASVLPITDILNQPITGTPNLKYNYKNYSSAAPLTLLRSGNVVSLYGTVTNLYDVSTSIGQDLMFTLPDGFRPPFPLRVLQQGSYVNRFMMFIDTDGSVYNDRYGSGSAITIPKNTWLNVFATYVVNN
ncbi:hypothetical protein [Leuconostoc pseudomesenteroides]|uniref:hypothetical protein n=1 Tax=Leuconostoc pseudomesenteroides TaxID=33968 RepID=UPI0039EA7422